MRALNRCTQQQISMLLPLLGASCSQLSCGSSTVMEDISFRLIFVYIFVFRRVSSAFPVAEFRFIWYIYISHEYNLKKTYANCTCCRCVLCALTLSFHLADGGICVSSIPNNVTFVLRAIYVYEHIYIYVILYLFIYLLVASLRHVILFLLTTIAYI